MASAARTKNPRDVTGRKAALAAEKHAEELKKRASEISTVTAAPEVAEPVEPVEDDMPSLKVGSPNKKLRVAVDLEDMTFGAGTTYNFYRGQVYTVPTPLYDHLERLGYVWH